MNPMGSVFTIAEDHATRSTHKGLGFEVFVLGQ